MNQSGPPPLDQAVPERDRVRFRITWPAAVALGLAFALLIVTSVKHHIPGQKDDLVPALVSVLLWPLFFGWLAFRLGRRSQRAGTTTCMVFVALIALSSASSIMREEQRYNARQMQDVQDDLRRDVMAADSAEQQVAAIERAQQRTVDIIDADSPETRAPVAVVNRMFDIVKKHAVNVGKLVDTDVTDAATLKAREGVHPRRKLVENMVESAQQVVDLLRNFEKEVDAELAKAGVSAARRQRIVASATRGIKNREAIVRVREMDVEIGKEMLIVLDLYETKWGAFKVTDGVLAFDDADAQKAFIEAATRLETMSELQLQLQQTSLKNSGN